MSFYLSPGAIVREIAQYTTIALLSSTVFSYFLSKKQQISQKTLYIVSSILGPILIGAFLYLTSYHDVISSIQTDEILHNLFMIIVGALLFSPINYIYLRLLNHIFPLNKFSKLLLITAAFIILVMMLPKIGSIIDNLICNNGSCMPY